MRTLPILILFVVSAASPLPALALEPLRVYLDGARSESHEVRAAQADIDSRADSVAARNWSFAPTLDVSAGYTRNQEEVAISLPDGTNAIITKQNQLDFTATARLPLFSPRRWTSRATAKQSLSASQSDALVTQFDVMLRTVRAYEDLRSSVAILESAANALTVAERALIDEQARVRAKSATALEVKRAEASVAQKQQLLADANFNIAQSKRALERLSGVAVSDLARTDLPESPAPGESSYWTELAKTSPEFRQAVQQNELALANADEAAAAAYLPDVSAFATERITNASGFGPSDQWSVGVTLNWSLDISTWRSKDALQSAARAQQIRTEYTSTLIRDGIADSYDAYQAAIVRAQAARAEEAASLEASRIAEKRYSAGASTQSDVLDAQRDALNAQVGRIQAEANARYAWAELCFRTGQDLEAK